MDWDQVLQFLVHTGILAAIAGVLIKLITKWLGDKLGWDEDKRHKATSLLISVANQAINAAEQSAKHKKFESAADQAVWKENYAAKMVTDLTGVDGDLAKSALRAVFHASELNNKPKTKHDEIHKFEDEEVNKIVEKLLGDQK